MGAAPAYDNWREYVVELAARRLARARPPWTDLEEIRQECWAALLLVVRETPVREAAYLIRAVQNKVVDQWRTDSDLHRSMVTDNNRAIDAGQPAPWGATSLEGMATASSGYFLTSSSSEPYVPVDDPGYERVEQITDAERLWERVMPLLSDRERTLFVALFVDGRHMHEMAAELGISESRVSQIIRRALARARLALGLPEPVAYDLQWLHHDHARPRKRFAIDGRQRA